jgi:hypothetical protein
MSECGLPEDRVVAVAEKGRLYGTRLISRYLPISPGAEAGALEDSLSRMYTPQIPDLFWGSLAWLNWIQVQKGAPAAMADLVIVEKIMQKLLELDDTYQAGSSHLFFGAYYATRPAMFGGDPEKSRNHFEKALKLSNRKFLLIQTTYAETLARQTFDQDLHDRLLQEVIDYPTDSAPEYALSNQIAKRKARRLLDDEYFAE